MSTSLRAVFRALVGRYLSHEKARTALTVLGVALGVAVLVAIDLANESAVASFKDTVRDVAGSASLTVRGNGIGLPGTMVGELDARPEIGNVSPLISGNITLPASDRGTTQTLLLLGIDVLQSGEGDGKLIRDIQFRPEEGRDVGTFLTDPTAAVFTQAFLRREGRKVGDELTFLVAGRRVLLRVAGTIEAGTLAETLDGNIVVMDIGIADGFLQRGGRVDRIDLTVPEGTDVDALSEKLARELSGSVMVERPETRGAQVDEMLAAFRFNLRALGHISILVGLFLIYNTMSVAVVRRRAAIGTARAMGVSRGKVRAVFLAEGMLIGATGAVLGIIGGLAMAYALLDSVSTAISINFVQTQATRLATSPQILIGAFLFGTIGAALAAWGPANEAATTPPANTMRQGSLEATQGWVLPTVGGVACAALGAVLLRQPATTGLPLVGYAAATLMVGACVCWSRPALVIATIILRPIYRMLFRGEGLLAVAGTRAALGRASIAICGLLVSLAMAVSVAVMVSSFRNTVILWMEQVLVADLYVTPSASDARSRPDPIPRAVADVIAGIPGVEAVDAFRLRQIFLKGKPALLGAGQLDVVRFTSKDLDGRPMMEVMREAKARGEAVVSEAFARKHGYKRGDILPIPTPKGDLPVRIAAVYYDYSSEQGYAMIDRELYLQYFDDPLIDSVAVYLTPEANRTAVRREANARLQRIDGLPLLTIRANTDLRDFALKAFDQTFAITTILQVIAVVVSILGVATTLLSQILDRKQELATLRYIGASQARVGRVIVLESAIIGIVGMVLGVAAGLVLSWVLTRVIMLQSFGWTIQFAIPWLTVLQVAAIIFGATILAGILPAREAGRMSR